MRRGSYTGYESTPRPEMVPLLIRLRDAYANPFGADKKGGRLLRPDAEHWQACVAHVLFSVIFRLHERGPRYQNCSLTARNNLEQEKIESVQHGGHR